MKTKTTQKYTDQEMYLLIQQKNRASFEQLYDQYSCLIYGLAIKAVRSKECADEVVELTFINVWNSMHLFNFQQKNFCVWLVNIFITTAKDYLDSKSIKFTMKTENFPDFSFEMLEVEAC